VNANFSLVKIQEHSNGEIKTDARTYTLAWQNPIAVQCLNTPLPSFLLLRKLNNTQIHLMDDRLREQHLKAYKY
jgi:hypothetical protein